MANDCLLTKLKGSIDNNELVKIGRTRLHMKGLLTAIDIDFSDVNAVSYIIGGVDDVVFADTNTKEHIGRIRSSTLPLNVEKDYILDVSKYRITSINLNSNGRTDNTIFNINELAYSKSFSVFFTYSPNITGDIKSLNSGKINTIAINNSKITGSIDSLLHAFDNSSRLQEGQTTLAILNLIGCNNITGNMKTLIDHIATFAHSGNTMHVYLEGTNVDNTGFSSKNVSLTFDGQGSYTID